jgi:hypothetical protein
MRCRIPEDFGLRLIACFDFLYVCVDCDVQINLAYICVAFILFYVNRCLKMYVFVHMCMLI